MEVIKVEPENFASNSYILTCDNTTAVVIDPSESRILEVLEGHNLSCKFVLLTHGHFDHIGACAALARKGAQIICGKEEKSFIFSAENAALFGAAPVQRFEISRTVNDGEQFNLCGIDFLAISTPGHTAGSMCYLAGNCLFSGDTLFRRSIGRTDLPTSDYFAITESVKKLLSLRLDATVYAGHGEDTSLEYERKYNPYIM